jgi:TonB family protein
MKAHTHLSIWLPISICVLLLVQGQTGLGGLLHQVAEGDTLKSTLSPKYVPKKDDTFKLLPKYSQEKDTAGFMLIPKHYDDEDFVPYDKEPQIVKKVEPKYPEAALRAALEGRVIVKMWVDTDGRVKKVVVLKSDSDIFNEPAIEAAKQFVFVPAYMNNEPVAIWVSYPFLFRLPSKN